VKLRDTKSNKNEVPPFVVEDLGDVEVSSGQLVASSDPDGTLDSVLLEARNLKMRDRWV
jgi:hypothetical protein